MAFSKFCQSQSIFNRGFLHCAILKALHGFKENRAHKARDMQSFLQNIQNEIFKILEIIKNNMKFTLAVCWINSKISNKRKNTALVILLFCHYCWSLLWCNYWRSLLLWTSTSWSRLKLNVQMQLAPHPWDPFFINNRNMTSKSVER